MFSGVLIGGVGRALFFEWFGAGWPALGQGGSGVVWLTCVFLLSVRSDRCLYWGRRRIEVWVVWSPERTSGRGAFVRVGMWAWLVS